MLDLFIRSLKHPCDYWPILKTHSVTFVEKIEEDAGTFSFLFEKPTNLSWHAGQHAVWYHVEKVEDKKQWRAFSIASSHHENIIRIATRTGDTPSGFKQKMLSLRTGEKMIMRGPFGELHPHQEKAKMICIAGGIGITPFRALAYDVGNQKINNTMHLIYASPAQYIFSEELNSWANSNENLKLHYTHTPEETTTQIHELVELYKNEAEYYISGSPGMIAGVTKDLHSLGIKKIISDPFKGY